MDNLCQFWSSAFCCHERRRIAVLNENVYLPERIFVRNLFELCNYSNQRFLDQINTIITSEIQFNINELRGKIENLEPNAMPSIYPHKFLDLINKINESNKSRKMFDYILFDCYINITDALRSLKNHNLTMMGKNDKDILLTFEHHIDKLGSNDCGAMSPRQLQRLLDPSGRQYGKKQINIIEYIIRNVIPEILIQQNQINHMCQKWDKVLFYYGHPLQKKIHIQGDNEYVKKIESFFSIKFSQISIKKNCGKIGDILLEIFREIIDLYHSNSLYFSNNQSENNQYTARQKKADNREYEYASELSSHILGFMRWIPIIADSEKDYGSELLVSIEQVIDEIQDQIVNDYSDIVTPQKLKQYKDGGLFIYNDQMNYEYLIKIKSLRKLLIKALYNNDYIRSKFKNFYQIMP